MERDRYERDRRGWNDSKRRSRSRSRDREYDRRDRDLDRDLDRDRGRDDRDRENRDRDSRDHRRRDRYTPDRDRDRDRDRRDREPDRRGARSRSPRRRGSRSRSPRRHTRSPDKGAAANGDRKKAAVVEEVDVDLGAGLTEEEIKMMRAMGIPLDFDTTAGKHVEDERANAGAVKTESKRSARQYMNRKKGFNKLLPAEATGEKLPPGA